MPDLVKKWREQHPYLSALEDEINADYNSQKYQYDKQNEQYEQQRKEYEQWVEANQYGPYGDERDRAGTGPNALTPDMEYRRQAAATPNKLTPYQVAMQAEMASLPTAPETRSNAQLRNEARSLDAASRVAKLESNRQGLLLSQDPTKMYNQQFTTGLRDLGKTANSLGAKAATAKEYASTIAAERAATEAWQNYAHFRDNPDFIANSKPDPKVENRVYYSMAHPEEAIEENGAAVNAAAYADEDDKAMYFYLWNTYGHKAADKFYDDYVLNKASAAKAADVQMKATAAGYEKPFASSVKSLGSNLISGVGLVDMFFQNIARDYGITNPNRALNYNSLAMMPSLVTDSMREGVMKKINGQNVDDETVDAAAWTAAWMYQLGMSMADSTVGMALNLIGVPQAATLALMGGAAGTRAIREARNRGATDGEALAFGFASAIAEAAFEKLSLDIGIDNIMKQFNGTKTTGRALMDLIGVKDRFGLASWLTTQLITGVVEGSEEGFTTIANTLADRIIMGDNSQFELQRRSLLEHGVSEEEATKAALKSWLADLGGDVLGGFISGGVMGGVQQLGGLAAGAVNGAVQTAADVQSGLIRTDLQNWVNANQQEQRLRQQYEQQNAPQQQTKLTIPSQETVSARQADPLGFAMNKAQSGETVTKQDARAIIENPQALQALRDSGVLTGKVTNDSEGRGKVVDAVNALAENQRQTAEIPAAAENISQETAQIPQETAQAAPVPAQENAQQEERVSTHPVPRAQQSASEAVTEGKLRIPEQENTPPLPRSGLTVRDTNDILNENRQEASNGQQTETAAFAEADERARAETAAFRKAANENAGSEVLDRAEWRAGLGRLLQAIRNSRVTRSSEQRRIEAARITNQAEAGNPDRLSAKELGVADGSDDKLAIVIDAKNLGTDAEEAVARLAKQGVSLKFISGQMWLNERDVNGDPVKVRAYVSADRKNIIVQADNPRVSWQQLLAHEELHRLIKEDADYRKRVMDALLADKKVKPYLSQIIDRYADAYHIANPKLTDEDIIEEMLADYRAGFDMLDPLGTNRTLAKVAKTAARDIKAVEKNYTTNGGKPAPAEIEEGFAEGKNSVEPPYRRGTAALTQFEESLSPKARKTYDLFNTLNNISRSGTAEIWVGSGKARHLKWDTIADKSFFAKDWNNYVKTNKEFAAIARELVAALPDSVKKFGNFNDDGTVTPTEFEEKFKMNRSFIQRVVDALPKNVVQPVMNIDGHEYRISDKPISGAVGGEEYRQAIIAEKRRLYKEGKLPTVSTGALSHDNWGAMGFLATNTKTGASGDFTTFCPQMYFNNGCFYCYRRAALTSGSNNKLTGETVWYSGEILQLRPEDVVSLNKKGGLRIQSFGDWQDMYTPMLADMLYDAQMKGLQIKIITKEPSMIETVARLRQQALGLSLYFNLSADYTIERRGESDNRETQKAAPLNAERPFIEQEWLTGEPGEDIGWKRALSVQEANEYRKKYPWVNTRIVATTLKEYIRGLIDPTVDVVTGYHGKIKYQERVSSETGETLIEVEALGDSGMPQFTKDEMTGEWSISRDADGKLLNGKNRYQKALCDAIVERGLQEAYYQKACCITGHCQECQGQCGAYANKMSTKNARNRDPDILRWTYLQMEAHPGAGMENSQLFAENIEDTEGLTQAEDLVDIYDREHGIEPLREKPVEQALEEQEKWLKKKDREAAKKAAKAEGKASTEIDTDYLAAVNSSDMETAQRMVDEAAKKAGYTVRKYHQTDVPNIHVFDIGIGTHGGTDSETPYGIFTKNTRADIGLGDIQMSLYLKPGKTFVIKDRSELRSRMPEAYNLLATKLEEVDAKYNALVEEAEDALFDAQDAYEEKHPEAEVTLDDIVNNRTYDDPACQRANEHWKAVMAEWSKEADKIRVQAKEVLSEYLRDNGYDSIEIKLDKGTNGRSTDTFIVFSPEQVKSADPVTYDDNGKAIPLSQRFNPENNDIRYSTEISDEDVGTTLRTAKGSPIKRSSKYGVGKEIGGRVYFHKQYAEDVIPSNEYERAQQIVAEEYPGFTYNCVEYEPKTGTIRFDEAPGFDTEREPAVGDYVEVKADGSTRKGHTDYIWHHKWSWVKNDYQGFDVVESWNWSKRWLGAITGKTYEVNGKQYNDNGKSDGNGIERWNAQLDAYGLPRDEVVQDKTDKFSLDVVPAVNPSNGKWARGLTEQQIKDMGYQLFGDVSQEEIDAMTPEEQEIYRAGHNTQVKNTVSSYQKVYDRLKAEHPDDWQNLRILDASSGLGYGTQAGREMGFDVTDIEPYPSKQKYANGKPKYTDYSALVKSIRDGQAEPYDVIISNAVLNVLPQDTVDNLVVAMGKLLKPGGEMYINTRDRGFLKDVLVSDKNRLLNYDGQLTINSTERDGKVKRQAVLPEGLPAYDAYIAQTKTVQRGFTYDELAAYLEDALGPGYTVSKASFLGSAAAKVTKNGGSASIEIDPEVAAQFSPEAIARRQSNRTKGVKGERKVSRVRSNTYEYSGLYNEVEAQMDEADEENYTYDPASEKKSMNEALGRLKADFDGEVSRLSEADRQWGGSDLDTAMGVLHRYRTEGRATGDYGDFWRWSKVIQEKGTKGGQFIQAFAKYTRTGTGAAMKGAKDIHDRFKLNPAQQKQVDAAKMRLMDGVDGDMDGAAQDAMKQAKGQKEPGKKQDGKVDKKKLDAEVQRRKDAERLVREISKLFEKQQDHGEPVENWLNLTGEELARKIAGRFSEPKQRTKTTMQTILSDLVGFAEEHALPDRKKAEGTKRTAIDIITDYLNNRDAYGTAWAAAQSYLRAAYTDDQEKLDALNSFLTATIAYNAEGTDRTMLDAILQSADVLGISERRILELASAGATASTIDRIGDELVSQVRERMGADYDESFTQQLKDAVRRHITGIALQESAEEQRLRLGGMTTDAARQLEINLQKLLTQSRGDKNRAAQSVADYLIRELGIPSSDAAIAAERITGAFTDELASRADRKLQQMFAEKKPKTQEQRDRLLDLIRLGGLTNSNVEDAVVDALGIGGMSRERQRELVGVMAQFGETLDAMEADDLDGLKDLIRAQAAVRKTPLSRQAEKTLAGETDAQYLREFALAQLDTIAGDFAEMSPGAKISTFQTISHLLNMRTALRNLTSNQVFDLVDSAANNLATIPDMVIGAFTGKRTVGVNKSWLSEMKRAGAKQGAARNALEVRLDVSPDDRQKSKYGTAGRRTNSMAASNAFGRILSHLEEVMGYELNTTDEFHKGSVRGETLESLARFVERGDITQEQANAWAEEEALYRSFQDDTLVGNIMGELKTLLNVIGFGDSGKTNSRGRTIHDFGLGDLVVKYTQVPGALIHRGIEYSPLGYAKMLYDLAIAKDSLVRTQRRGEDVTNAQRKLALDIGRATTGSGLITLFAVLAKAGLLRRDDDDKDKNAKAMHAAQGLSGTQLNLTALKRWIEGGDLSLTDGDVLADIGFLEPLDSLMTIATLMANDDDLKLADIGVKSLDGVWKAISNTSAMQTISNIISTVQYHDEENDLPLYFQIPIEIASDSISGFVPSPVRQLAQATDTTYRDQYRSKELNDQIRAKVMNSIPGVRQMLAPKITPLGEDKKYQKPLLNYLNATLNPGNINVYQGSGVVDELNRVYGETDDAKIWPERNAPYSFAANDEKWTLTPDERTQYQRTRGQTTANAMDAVMGTDWYKSMGATDQAEVLNWIGNFSNFVAKKEMLESRGQEYGSTTYNKYYEAWQGGTPIEEVVADKYGKLVTAAAETAKAETIIAEAKIPDASKEEAETMSADAKRLYAAFLQGGVSDSTARNLATSMEGSEASGHEQWRMVYDAAGKEGEKAVTSVMTDDMKRNWNLAKDAGVSMDDYIKVREGFKDLNGNGKQTQDEWNATLDSYTFSTNEAKDKSIKGTLWQILTGSGSTKNNPYDKEAGQKVIDAKNGGGSGSGSYAPVRIPTLRLPDIPKAEKPSSGLRIRAAAPAAQAPRSGLRIKAQ